MKGSTNAQGSGSSGGPPIGLMKTAMNYMIPGTFPRSTAGTGSKGADPYGGANSTPMTMPAMPQYVNYQQMPTAYSQQSVAPSDAIMRFLSSGYASGGAAKSNSLEDDIEAAIRIARMIGELTKKL